MHQGSIMGKLPENVVQCHVGKLGDGRDTEIVQGSCSGLIGAGSASKCDFISGVEVTAALQLLNTKGQYNHESQSEVRRTESWIRILVASLSAPKTA